MSRNSVSRTGLTASPKKLQRPIKLTVNGINLTKCPIAKPVQYSLRPFGGLFNPYPKGCSILCNHPGPNEVKNVVKHVKEQFIESKGHFFKDTHQDVDQLTDPSQIPEEYFRRYAGSDSRPLTPTPTVISGRTRTSTGSHLVQARRCFTPDPIKSFAQERKQLIVDLRRSHSQETLFWNASSEISTVIVTQDTALRTTSGANNASSSNAPTQSKNMRLCEQEARKRSAELKAQQQKEAEMRAAANTIVCINERNDNEEDQEGARRRGKKKKKTKTAVNNKGFRNNQEPETQIATIGPDSPTVSARPTLAANNANLQKELSLKTDPGKHNGPKDYANCSFISQEALKILQRGLNMDIVESAFQKYMGKALKEAFRTIPPDQINADSQALHQFKQTITLKDLDNEKWITMPRRYTRCSARFTLPINTQDLTNMSPLQYVSKHVWITDYRKQLYRYVFTKFLHEDDVNEMTSENNVEEINVESSNRNNVFESSQANTPTDTGSKIHFSYLKERLMDFKQIDSALIDVLGFHGTSERINEIKEILMLDTNPIDMVNFRSWCGIVAFAERFLNTNPISEDPCDEVEIADFESLERKYSYVSVSDSLRFILDFLKNH